MRTEIRVRRHGSYPPGPKDFNFARTLRMVRDPLPLLLSLYEEHYVNYSSWASHRIPEVFPEPEARTMTVRQMPTLSSRGGLRMRVLPRA